MYYLLRKIADLHINSIVSYFPACLNATPPSKMVSVIVLHIKNYRVIALYF